MQKLRSYPIDTCKCRITSCIAGYALRNLQANVCLEFTNAVKHFQVPVFQEEHVEAIYPMTESSTRAYS